MQDGLSKNLRSPDKGVLCPFEPLGADYRESESRKGSGKAAFAYRFVNYNEISVINQRFPKNIHTCTKDIAEQFDLKQAIKIPNLLSSQYAV